MRLNLVFYGEDKTVIYETSHSRKREKNISNSFDGVKLSAGLKCRMEIEEKTIINSLSSIQNVV